MAKTVLLAGLLVCFVGHLFSVTGQGQEQPVPDVRQFLYAPMSALGSEVGAVAPPAVVGSPPVVNPCQSLDAQYPQQPCSPLQERPNPAYLPVATPAPAYQPQAVQTLPQTMPSAPLLPPMPNVYMDYNRYPDVNNKQLADDRTPITPEDEVPSQYI
ncbi:uncharacterized protein LOC130701166 [Daphnia carinata]|uniref:uncharacterized protein LOC130701166 n=1 Tax=Daphnia carinata TaxID=120202 RepID=UPI00257FD4BC|nr:uncharacterized protein LOC130701166 [Daphnia carinata]